MSYALLGLCCYFHSCCRGSVTGVSFIDSSSIKVCHNNRARSPKVFAALAEWGKNSLGFYFGFKLHLVINARGEILNFQVTPANVDERRVRNSRKRLPEKFWESKVIFLDVYSNNCMKEDYS